MMNRDKAEELFLERGYIIRYGLFDAGELEVLKEEIPLLVDAHRETLGLPSATEVPNAERLLDRILCIHHTHKIADGFLKLAADPGSQGCWRRSLAQVMGREPYEWKGYQDRSVPHPRLWPDPGRPPEPASPDCRMRSRITAAIRVRSHDERRAVDLFRAAFDDKDPPEIISK
jgi:hypothetical protein